MRGKHSPQQKGKNNMNTRLDERHPFDIPVALCAPKVRPVPVVRDHRSVIENAYFDKRYTLGEWELLRMLGYDAARVVLEEFTDPVDREIRKPRATSSYGPEWYDSQTFDLEAYRTGQVHAYGMLNRNLVEVEDAVVVVDDDDDDTGLDAGVDTSTHQWLLGVAV